MAGIGFELRRLFREQGLVNNVKAYTYSSLTTVGPMILCMLLIFALQRIMSANDNSYLEWELYIATVSYCFVFSIVITSGVSIVLTRYVADMIYGRNYERLMSSFYGVLVVMLPLGAATAAIFLTRVEADLLYKAAAYLFFMELIVIWLQGVYLSALKDYIRIVRGFAIGVVAALAGGWLIFKYTDIQATTAALAGIDIGFFIMAVLSFHHFRQKFPAADSKRFFEFLGYFKKYKTLFLTGCFVYSGVYVHNFVYWFGPRGNEIAEGFRVMSYYDLPVFYAFLTVMPTLVTFVVSVETAFYEKFRLYYLNILNNGTIQDIQIAKKNMQRTLIREISVMMEIQLLFTVLSIALGIKFLPTIGFTMAQLDLFNMLALGYFLFILLFVFVHILMYFDDRKGVLAISSLFVVLNIGMTYWTMHEGYDGLGMFIASFVALAAVIARLLYVLRNIDYFTFCAQPIYQREQKKRKRGKAFIPGNSHTLISIVVIALLLTGCTVDSDSGYETEETSEAVVSPSLDVGLKLTEDKRLYERDDDGSLKTIYVTILPDKSGDDSALDWYELNRLPERNQEADLDIIMQEGRPNGEGPDNGYFGFGQQQANATITLRGRSAWFMSQKSYRIKLFDEAGVWMDQRTLNLNKHMSDDVRMVNKLSFDLFEKMDHITSLRTQFVHLYVKDLTQGSGNAGYQDYGLYTHVEQPNKKFLRSHLLDPNGQLYKASFFEFDRYPEAIKSQDDPTYDKIQFESILEIKGREDHNKLINMLDDLNNMRIPVEEVIEKHFDLDNFLTWTAANILTDNLDTDSSNFFLYSPLNSEKWYFLPWDYDGGWGMGRDFEAGEFARSGLSRYWNMKLHNRFFRSPENVELLVDKINELYKEVINEENISKLAQTYKPVVEPYLYRYPDVQYLEIDNRQFSEIVEGLKDIPRQSIDRFMRDVERPKPFFQNDVVTEGNGLVLSWGLSFDIQGDDLHYDVMVATDPQFANVVETHTQLTGLSVTIQKPKPGVYYWKVIARDSHGNENVSFDYYTDREGDNHYGMREFEVQ